MEEHITLFVENLEDILAKGISHQDDFATLAITGEQLRRALLLASADHPRAHDALARYDALLTDHEGPVTSGLAESLDAALAELKAQAFAPGHRKDPEAAEEGAMWVEEVLCVAAARHRAGQMSAERLGALARKAQDGVGGLAARLYDLWELADDRSLAFAQDPDFPGLFSWWENLAALSEARLELQGALAIRSSQVDPARLRDAVDVVSRGLAQSPAPSFGERLAAFLDMVSEWAAPAPLPADAYGSTDGPPEVETLGGREDLITLLLEEGALVLMAAPGHGLELESAALDDGRAATATPQGEEGLRLKLPDAAAGSTLTVVVRVDGETVRLPVIRLSDTVEG